MCLLAYTGVSAASGVINTPFDTGSLWYICQGYNNQNGTHSGTSSLSLDLTGGQACDNSASGRNIRSPFPGVVAWYVQPSGSICINSLSGNSIMITHIDSSIAQGAVLSTGQIIGSVAAPYQRQNNGVAHAHLQAWSSSGCAGDMRRITFDNASGMQLCGAPDLTSDGPNPYNNGTWSGVSFIAKDCNTSSPDVYRLYSPVTQRHLFTSDSNEAVTLQKGGWRYEGVAYGVKSLSNCAANESIYRFYSDQLKTHLYTADENEKTHIINTYTSNVWRYEGVAFCAASTQENAAKPVYRFYSEQLKSHLFTADENEKNTIIGWNDPSVWRYEGVAYFTTPR